MRPCLHLTKEPMKKLFLLAPALLALTFVTPAFAAEAEDPAPAATAVTNAAGTNDAETPGITIGGGKHGIVIRGGMSAPFPPEVMNKLSSQDLLELERMRHSRGFDLEGVLVPLAFFAGVAVIVALVTTYRMKKTRMLQETIRLMVEKGTPIPPELLLPPEPRKRPRSDLRAGLAWCGIGLALLVYLSGLGHRLWALGLIPLLIGVAFLVAWKVEQKKVQ